MALAPSAALSVVARVGEADVAPLRRQDLSTGSPGIQEVRAREQRCSKLKQIEVIASVAIGKSRNPAIGAMAMHSEFAGAFQALVIVVGKAETEAADIFGAAQIRAQHHH